MLDKSTKYEEWFCRCCDISNGNSNSATSDGLNRYGNDITCMKNSSPYTSCIIRTNILNFGNGVITDI